MYLHIGLQTYQTETQMNLFDIETRNLDNPNISIWLCLDPQKINSGLVKYILSVLGKSKKNVLDFKYRLF
jgi:hypothetical protein